jgi:hypothetical protein
MPLHVEDLQFIPKFQEKITQQITQHPKLTKIICGDFNRTIILLGRHHDIPTSKRHTIEELH